jgi:hypothetical protein
VVSLATIAVSLAAFALLTTAAKGPDLDKRERNHCSMRGEKADLGPGFQSKVERPGRFIGLSESAAHDLARTNGYTGRVTCRDGSDLIGTADFRLDRINFGVEHGLVVGYWLG